jgi:lactoylglutathione lyase
MKAYLLILIGLLALKPFQKSMAQNIAKSPAVLNHIAVYVADLKTSTDFYEGVFNLEKIDEPFKDGKHTWFKLGSISHLHLIQGAKTKINYDKNEHLCFSVASVEAFIAKLKSRNIGFESWAGAKDEFTLRVDGVKQIYFRDPDGHWLEVNDAKN